MESALSAVGHGVMVFDCVDRCYPGTILDLGSSHLAVSPVAVLPVLFIVISLQLNGSCRLGDIRNHRTRWCFRIPPPCVTSLALSRVCARGPLSQLFSEPVLSCQQWESVSSSPPPFFFCPFVILFLCFHYPPHRTVLIEAGSDDEKDEEEEKEFEPSEKDQGLKGFLSPAAREAVDGVLQDPDVQQLGGRLQGFASERLLAAEAAARIITGEDEKEAGGAKGDGTSPGTGTGGAVEEGKGETPILSGLANDTRGFVERRMGEFKGGAQEVWKEASEVVEERRKEARDAGRSEGKNELPDGEISTTEQERREKGDQHGVDRAEGGGVVGEDKVDLSRPKK